MRIDDQAESVQPPPRNEPPAGVVDLWLRRVRPQEPVDLWLPAPDERKRAARLVSDEARTLFVVGRSLLRVVLAGYLGLAPQALRLDQRCPRCGAQHGKPRLAAPVSDLTFNLSHAQGLIALAVCRGREIGIDVEWRGRSATMPELVPLLLSAAERQALEEIPAARQPEVLLESWVRKEALLKATGEGLGRDPRDVVVPLGQEGPMVYRRGGTWWGVYGLEVGPDHTGALAVRECMPRLRGRSLERISV